MSILWASLKCTLKEGEKLLSVSSGLFGEGFAEMGRALGFESELVSFDYDDVPEPDKVYESAPVPFLPCIQSCTDQNIHLFSY